jgi:hypothetical protein
MGDEQQLCAGAIVTHPEKDSEPQGWLAWLTGKTPGREASDPLLCLGGRDREREAGQ